MLNWGMRLALEISLKEEVSRIKKNGLKNLQSSGEPKSAKIQRKKLMQGRNRAGREV